jgi:hypothetical protein
MKWESSKNFAVLGTRCGTDAARLSTGKFASRAVRDRSFSNHLWHFTAGYAAGIPGISVYCGVGLVSGVNEETLKVLGS